MEFTLVLQQLSILSPYLMSQVSSGLNLWLVLGAPIAGILFTILLISRLFKREEGTEKMIHIASAIRKGSNAFLKRQYTFILFFVLAVSFLLYWLYVIKTQVPYGHLTAFAFIIGAVVSALSGIVGMKVATFSNARTAWAAKTSLNDGLRVAFSAGNIMGISVVSLGLLSVGLTIFYVINLENIDQKSTALILFSFGMGASSIALFARIGGGIYTKAADVGADLVGKIEAGIPEDDPRNPATIADNVGDNVGDVAGMGADLFESYVGSIIATIVLAFSAYQGTQLVSAVMAPLALASVGIIASMLGSLMVRTKENATQESLLWSLRIGIYFSSFAVVVMAYFVMNYIFRLGNGVFISICTGLAAGIIIGYFTEYYTSDTYKPTQALAKSAETGPATVMIAGLGLGMQSTTIPVVTIVLATIIAYFSSNGGVNPAQGLFGIGMAAVGMLSTLGITLSTDAYGPVADNAGGIAEMSDIPAEVRKRTDALDSLGNTTAATGKGFAIGSAALTALTLISALIGSLHIFSDRMDFNLSNPLTLSGLFIGAMIPFSFSAMTMNAVGKAAMAMVQEVRRQFKEIEGIMEGTTEPDYERCVAISTDGSLKQMIAPTTLAIMSPILTGLFLGPAALISMLGGALVSGFCMAVMMANAGGAWDNAKKYIERGNLGGKGSEAHKAAVTGDTVGDPFKDTSGPSINILIKLMSMVSLVFGPYLATLHFYILKSY